MFNNKEKTAIKVLAWSIAGPLVASVAFMGVGLLVFAIKLFSNALTF